MPAFSANKRCLPRQEVIYEGVDMTTHVLSPWKFPQVEIKEHVQQALQVVLPALVFLFMSPQRCIPAIRDGRRGTVNRYCTDR